MKHAPSTRHAAHGCVVTTMSILNEGCKPPPVEIAEILALNDFARTLHAPHAECGLADGSDLEHARPRELARMFASSEAARMADDVLLRRTDWALDPAVQMHAREVVDDALSAALRSLDKETP